MKSFGKYFWYHFKSTLPRLLVLAILGIILTFSFVFYEESSYTVNNIPQTSIIITTEVLGWISGICATVIPILELYGFKNRRNMDTLLFFPVSRTKMAFAHWLNGFIHIIAVSAICFIITALALLRYSNIYPVWAMIPYFALLMLASVAIYSLFSFLYTQANTDADGTVFILSYTVIGMILLVCVNSFWDISKKIEVEWFSPYSAIAYVVDAYDKFITPEIYYIQGSLNYHLNLNWSNVETILLTSWSLIGAASLLGYLFSFAKQKPQKIGDISDSVFGYKVLIPLTCLSVIFSGFNEIISLIALIAMVVGYVIYRRGFKLKLFDLVFLGTAFVAFVCELTF